MATRKTKTTEVTEATAPTEVKKPRRAAAPKAETTEAAPAAPKRARKPKAEVATEMVPAQASVIHHDERLRHISEAAYYLAERRGFTPGFEHDDWVQAEAEVSEKQKG